MVMADQREKDSALWAISSKIVHDGQSGGQKCTMRSKRERQRRSAVLGGWIISKIHDLKGKTKVESPWS